MKHLISHKLFEINKLDSDNDKYIIIIGSANSSVSGVLNPYKWVHKSDNLERCDAINWSISANVYKLYNHAWSSIVKSKIFDETAFNKTLTNKEIADRIRKLDNSDCHYIDSIRKFQNLLSNSKKKLSNDISKLFNKFKKLPLEKKIAFMIELEFEGFVFCENSDIIKVIDGKDLEYEVESISSRFEYFLLEE